jgi:ankyrin repeat protein
MSRFKKHLILLVMVVILFMPVLAEDIFEAVKKKDLDQVKVILEKNPELLNARGEYERTPLILAVISLDKDIFKFLVEKGADVNLPDKQGLCALHFVALRGERELADLLISKGADINSNKNVGGATPLGIAVSRGHKDIVELLIAKGAQLNLKDKRGNTPLLRAMSAGQQDIIKLLLTKGASVHEKDSMGSTPLLLAALNGQKDLVELFISHGANVNAKNSIGGTPVSVAAREGHQEIVDLLIAKGAKKEFIKQPVLEGEYLGQQKPGLTPELFAPGVVSTEKSELNSVFTPDGKEFYFTIKCKIMVMKQENNRWIKPEVTSFSGEYCDVDLFISPDGKKLYYCSNRPLEGKEESKKDFDIWVVERIKDGWSAPQNLGNPINSTEDEFYPSVTRDGTMYFQSQRPDSKGSKDIYRSKPVNGKYEKVENVGDVINSEFFEGDVLISPDEGFMIFSVERPGGFGRGDLYLSSRDKNDNWTTPENMGNEINTEHHENCPILSPDGKFLFFTRHNDIFWVDAGIIQKFKK